jgi:hypothetical protein
MNQIMQQLNYHNTMDMTHMRHIRRRNRVKATSGWLVLRTATPITNYGA